MLTAEDVVREIVESTFGAALTDSGYDLSEFDIREWENSSSNENNHTYIIGIGEDIVMLYREGYDGFELGEPTVEFLGPRYC